MLISLIMYVPASGVLECDGCEDYLTVGDSAINVIVSTDKQFSLCLECYKTLFNVMLAFADIEEA